MLRASLLVVGILAFGCSPKSPELSQIAAWPGRLYWIDREGDLFEAALDGSNRKPIVRGAKIIGGFSTSVEDGQVVLIAQGVGALTSQLALAVRPRLSEAEIRQGFPAIDAPGLFVKVEYRHDADSPNGDCLPGPLVAMVVPGQEAGAWKVDLREGCAQGPRVVGMAATGYGWVLANGQLSIWDWKSGATREVLNARDAVVWPIARDGAASYPEMRTKATRWRLQSPEDWKR